MRDLVSIAVSHVHSMVQLRFTDSINSALIFVCVLHIFFDHIYAHQHSHKKFTKVKVPRAV